MIFSGETLSYRLGKVMAWMVMGGQPAFMATKFHVQSKAKNSKKAISCLVIVFVISLIIAPKTCRKRKQLFTARSLPVFCISGH